MGTPEESILAQISREELVDLALTMGNIYSPTGHEGQMTAFVHGWMGRKPQALSFACTSTESRN